MKSIVLGNLQRELANVDYDKLDLQLLDSLRNEVRRKTEQLILEDKTGG